jgi:putative transposase
MKNSTFVRKPNRLPLKNLYQGGYWYFITICTHNKECIFVEEPLRFQKRPSSRYQNNGFRLDKLGRDLEELWQEIPQLFSGVILDEFVIMPNHFHGILGFEEKVYYKNNSRLQSLSDLVAKFKSIYWTRVKDYLEWNGKRSATIWQKSFYDHVIRNEKDFLRIREYIINNPLNWHLDSLNPKNNPE